MTMTISDKMECLKKIFEKSCSKILDRNVAVVPLQRI